MRTFNTTGLCVPERHYMVDVSGCVAQIRAMVDRGDYLCVNRARQYGKTTTLTALERALTDEYDVASLDFQALGHADFRTEGHFVRALSRTITHMVSLPPQTATEMGALAKGDVGDMSLGDLFFAFSTWCSESSRPVVLIVDEVDSATNNHVFLDFLAQLRLQYLQREKRPDFPAFRSVILAGVTDVRHLKTKIRSSEQRKVNSPWNIAADFDVDMSLSANGIKGMLDEYEDDHATGMDTTAIAACIRQYTGGYPYLVSRICQLIDTKLVPNKFKSPTVAWTPHGVDEAVRLILSENSPLFDSVMGKLIDYPDLKEQLRDILMRGETIAYLPDDEGQRQLRMYGFIRVEDNCVTVSNRIFEMRLYTYFIGESSKNNDLKRLAATERCAFIDSDGRLDVAKIMERFIDTHNRIHGESTAKFLEEEGRERFLTYLSPIINGTGTYSIEEQTRDRSRMDVVIHYLGRRYVIELKIWHGERYKEQGEQQITRYLDYWGLDTGYLLSFNFNKRKTPGVRPVHVGGKLLYEGIV